MKKLLGLVCVVLSLALLPVFAGCSGGKDMSNSPYVGNWVATNASMSGYSLSVDSIFEDGFSFELKKDGKVTLNVDGETTNGTWDETDDGFSIEDEFEIVVDGTTGTMDYSGITLTFEKEGSA